MKKIFICLLFLLINKNALSCPKEKPMRVSNEFQTIGSHAKLITDDYYRCESCSSLEIWKTTKSECEKCTNREYNNGWCYFKKNGCPSDFIWYIGFCVEKKHCAENEIMAFNPSYFDKEDGRVTVHGSLDDAYSECINCFDKRDIEISKEECSLCSNRQFKDGWCVLVEE